MGKRGPEKIYDVTLKLTLTHSQDEFLRAMSQLLSISKQEALRQMLDQAFVYSLAASVNRQDLG